MQAARRHLLDVADVCQSRLIDGTAGEAVLQNPLPGLTACLPLIWSAMLGRYVCMCVCIYCIHFMYIYMHICIAVYLHRHICIYLVYI